MAKEHKKFASAPHLMILLSILLLSMGFLGWLLHTLHDRHQQRLHEHFLTDVGHLTATIDWYMDAYTQILHGAAGLFLADGKVSRENWQSYVEHLQLEEVPSTISGSWGLKVVLQARQVYRRRTTQRVTRLPWMGRSR